MSRESPLGRPTRLCVFRPHRSLTYSNLRGSGRLYWLLRWHCQRRSHNPGFEGPPLGHYTPHSQFASLGLLLVLTTAPIVLCQVCPETKLPSYTQPERHGANHNTGVAGVTAWPPQIPLQSFFLYTVTSSSTSVVGGVFTPLVCLYHLKICV